VPSRGKNRRGLARSGVIRGAVIERRRKVKTQGNGRALKKVPESQTVVKGVRERAFRGAELKEDEG